MDKEQLQQAFIDVSALKFQEFEIALLVGTLIDSTLDLQTVRENFERFLASISESKIADVSQLLASFKQHGCLLYTSDAADE